MLPSWVGESGEGIHDDWMGWVQVSRRPPTRNQRPPSIWMGEQRRDHVVDVSQVDAKPFLRRTRTAWCEKGPRGSVDQRERIEAMTRKEPGAPCGWKRVDGTSLFSVRRSPPSLDTSGKDWCVLGPPYAIASILVRVPPGSIRSCIVRKDERGRRRRRMDRCLS